MVAKKSNEFDGFYSAYSTGIAGSSFGMFVFKDGIISGSDVGGGNYSGNFVISEDGRDLSGKVIFTIPIGQQTITGTAATTEPITFEVPFQLPTEINRNDVHRIETPAGPINMKFEKLRGFNE